MGSFFTWKCEGKGVKKKKLVLKEEWTLIGSSLMKKCGLERGVVPDGEFFLMEM